MRDIDVRRSLHRKVLAGHANDPNTLVIDELGLLQGEARVDIAVINGRLHGFEIKSAHDTLARLPRQVEVYGKVLDGVTLVVAHCHAEKAQNLIPDWWGIKVATSGTRGAVHFKNRRPSRKNPSIDPLCLVELLWRDEALAVLDKMNLARGFRGKPRRAVFERLVSSLSLAELRFVVRAALKSREGWRC